MEYNKLDITFKEGTESLPLIIFIHGLGMDKHIWTDPSQSRVLAGRFPLTVMLSNKMPKKISCKKRRKFIRLTGGSAPKHLSTLFHPLDERGFPALAWSQKRPAGSLHHAVDELRFIADTYPSLTKNGIIIIGHSRGGLIGKQYALRFPERIRALISIGSPFQGSSLARWAKIVSKTTSMLAPLLQGAEKGTVKSSLKHVTDFISSPAVRELLTGSRVLSSLSKPLPSQIKALCIAGTSPRLFTLYGWKKKTQVTELNTREDYLVPKLLFAFPDSLAKMVPDFITPDELKKGKGDGLVAQESAIVKNCDDSAIFTANHAELLFSKPVHQKVLRFVEEVV